MAKLQLPLPVEKEIPLNLPIDEDPGQDAFVKVRLATVEEEHSVSELTKNVTRQYNADGSMNVTFLYSNPDLRRLQVYLTMTDCSILDESGDKPLFRFQRDGGIMRSAMSRAEFNAAWGKLPTNWANAIIRAMFAVNKSWDPLYQGE